MLSLPAARYRCTACGDCCRGWEVPLERGEADQFLRLAATLVPAERLTKAVNRKREGNRQMETLAGAGRSCVALKPDELCGIHAEHGEAAKPKACRIYPFTFVKTPTAVRVGLSYGCPAVLDAEGPPLAEQRAEIEAVFTAAVDGTRYLLEHGDEVRLSDGLRLSWPDAERLIAELAASLRADGSLVERVCRAAAIVELVQTQLGEGAGFDAALAAARDGAAELAAEVLAGPAEVDRLSQLLFRTLLKSTENLSAARRMGNLFSSIFGGGSLHLRTGDDVSWRDIEAVAPGLGQDGEALVARWFAGALESCTFFGESAFELTLTGGLSLLVLSASVSAFLARAYAARDSRSSVSYEDVKRALRQLDAGLTHRGNMPRGFARAIGGIASIDLLRIQLG